MRGLAEMADATTAIAGLRITRMGWCLCITSTSPLMSRAGLNAPVAPSVSLHARHAGDAARISTAANSQFQRVGGIIPLA